MGINFDIENQTVESAKNCASKIDEKEARKRAYALYIAGNAAADCLNSLGVEISTKQSLYKIPSFARSFELGDIYAGEVRLDVRLTNDGETFYVPKIHGKYDAKPSAYIVMKLSSGLKKAEILGFVSSNELEKTESDSEYYSYDVNVLKPIEELKDFVEAVEVEAHPYSSDDHEKIKELSVSFIDDEISDSEKVYFIKHVIACEACRVTFCDLNDFDIIVSQIRNHHELLNDSTLSVLLGNKKEIEDSASIEIPIITPILPVVGAIVPPVVPIVVPPVAPIMASVVDEEFDLSSDVSLFDMVDGDEPDASQEGEEQESETEESIELGIHESVEDEILFLQDEEEISLYVQDEDEPIEKIIEEDTLEQVTEPESLEEELSEAPQELSEESLNLHALEPMEELAEIGGEDFVLEGHSEEIVEEAKEALPEEQIEEIQGEILDEIHDEIVEEQEESYKEDLSEHSLELGDLEVLDGLEAEDELIEEIEEIEPQEEISESIEQEEPEKISEVEDFEEPEEEETFAVEEEVFESNEEEESIGFEEELFESNEEPEEAEPQIEETDSAIQGLLDDDLLALLSDDNDEQVEPAALSETKNEIEEDVEAIEVSGEELLDFEEERQPEDEEQFEADESLEKDDTIETLFDNSEPQTTEDYEGSELNLEEDTSPKTAAGSAKKMIILASLLIVVGVGAGASWFINSQKSAMPSGDASFDANGSDNQVFDFQNKGSKSDTEGPAVSQDINKSMANSFSDKPAAITITKIAWQVSENLASDPSVKNYLQIAGKNIQMNLQNDLSYASDIAFNNSIKVSFVIAPDNTMKGMQVLESSGSDKIDETVQTSIKNTLKSIKVPKSKDNKSDYFLTIVINF